MLNDKRRATRRPIRYTAWIKLSDQQLHGCVLADISDTGARLDVENPDAIPDEFTLLLSKSGKPSRKCKVIWRNGDQIGVDFERKLPSHGIPKRERHAAAPPIAPDAEPVIEPKFETADAKDETDS